MTLENGAIAVDSYELDVATVQPSKATELQLYFRVAKKGAQDMRFQIELWPADGPNRTRPAKSRLTLTGAGLFPSGRWHEGELVRDRMKLSIPSAWKSESGPTTIKVGLRASKSGKASAGTPAVQFDGPLREGSKDVLIIGEFTMAAPEKPETTPTKPLPETAKDKRALPAKGSAGLRRAMTVEGTRAKPPKTGTP